MGIHTRYSMGSQGATNSFPTITGPRHWSCCMQHDGERGPTFGATSGEQLVSEDRRSMEDGIIVYQIDMSTEVYDMGLQWSTYFRVS